MTFAFLYKSNLNLNENIMNKMHLYAQSVMKKIPKKFKSNIYQAPCNAVNIGLLFFLRILMPKHEFQLLDNNLNPNSRTIKLASKWGHSVKKIKGFKPDYKDFVLIAKSHAKILENQFIEKGLTHKKDYIIVL
jgi:hypothetical protein